jgi:hypothetical protein
MNFAVLCDDYELLVWGYDRKPREEGVSTVKVTIDQLTTLGSH